MKMKKILFLGPQGSGKSTQAKLLSEKLGIPYLSSGYILRNIAKEKTGIGRYIEKTINAGNLVPDDKMMVIMEDYIKRLEYREGYILDGYPRTLEQVKVFGPKFDAVFYLYLPEEVVIERLARRGREDDTPELIKTRLGLYYKQTQPLLDYYKRLGILIEIKAESSIKSIHDDIRSRLS